MADGRRGVRGLQDAEQHLVRDGVGAEAVADVAALAHDLQYGLALGVVVGGGGRTDGLWRFHGRGRAHVLVLLAGVAGVQVVDALDDLGVGLARRRYRGRGVFGFGGRGDGLRCRGLRRDQDRFGRRGGEVRGRGHLTAVDGQELAHGLRGAVGHGHDRFLLLLLLLLLLLRHVGVRQGLGALGGVRCGGGGGGGDLGGLRLRVGCRGRLGADELRRGPDVRLCLRLRGLYLDRSGLFRCRGRLGFGDLGHDRIGLHDGHGRVGRLGVPALGLGCLGGRGFLGRGGLRGVCRRGLTESLRCFCRYRRRCFLRSRLHGSHRGHGDLLGLRNRGGLLGPSDVLSLLGGLRHGGHGLRRDRLGSRYGLLRGAGHLLRLGLRRLFRRRSLHRSRSLRRSRSRRRSRSLRLSRSLHLRGSLLRFAGLVGAPGRPARRRHGLRRHAGHERLGRAHRLGHLLLRYRNNRFRRPRPGVHRGLLGLRHRLRSPGCRRLRDRHGGLRHVEVLGPRGRRAGVPYRRVGGAAVGEGADRARGGVRDRRTEVEGPARRDRGGRGVLCRVGQPDAAEVDRAAVATGHLVRAGLVHGLHDRLRRRRRDLVAPGTLGSRQQQQVLVLGGGLGEVGVRAGCGDARLLHHACVLRQPLARDLAGVGHA
ncbi:hypothetical protein RKD32_001420 [Streptomyces sp. SAI-195]